MALQGANLANWLRMNPGATPPVDSPAPTAANYMRAEQMTPGPSASTPGVFSGLDQLQAQQAGVDTNQQGALAKYFQNTPRTLENQYASQPKQAMQTLPTVWNQGQNSQSGLFGGHIGNAFSGSGGITRPQFSSSQGQYSSPFGYGGNAYTGLQNNLYGNMGGYSPGGFRRGGLLG